MPWPLFGGFLLLQMEQDREREDRARRAREEWFHASQLPLATDSSASVSGVPSGSLMRSVVSVRGS